MKLEHPVSSSVILILAPYPPCFLAYLANFVCGSQEQNHEQTDLLLITGCPPRSHPLTWQVFSVSLQCEDDGQTFFTLDDGNTKFSDLIQLVDFYQLNKGVLPCKLKHHCIRVAL